MNVAIGLDIGGTKIAAVAVSHDGDVVESGCAPTDAAAGARAVIAAACALGTRIAGAASAGGHTVVVAGVGAAGVVDPHGRIAYATGTLPGWAGTDVGGEVAAALHVPVRVLNDVHALAAGELAAARHGTAADMLIVAIGTGVGGALVRQGRLVIGRTGAAGSVAHLLTGRAEGRICSCGQPDHLEAYGSGPAIAATYARAAALPSVPTLREVAAAAATDARAAAAIDEAAQVTGRTLAGLVTVLDPDVVVIGGGVAEIGDRYLGPLSAALRAATLPPTAGVDIQPAAFGSLSAAVGAARAALQAHM